MMNLSIKIKNFQKEKVFDIRDFGARPEKDLLNTEAFLAAAAACEKVGGGVILVAGGSYCMGTVYIPSHTTLFIAADSEIKASRNVDLLLAKKRSRSMTERASQARVLLYALRMQRM